MLEMLAILGASLAGSVIAIWAFIPLAWKVGFVCPPNGITSSHGTTVALGGGIVVIAVVLAALAALASVGQPTTMLVRVAVGVLALALLGLLDDARPLSPGIKLILQALAILPYLSLSHMHFLPGVAAWGFLLVCVNAWNLVDVMDGLFASIAIPAFLGLALAASPAWPATSTIGLIALIAAAAVAGFLVWNRQPARIFMGDCGSLSLGMLFGVLIIEITQVNVRLGALAAMNGTIPALEIALLVLERRRKGIPFYRKSADHFALRLVHQGFSVAWVARTTAWTGLLLALLAGAAAWWCDTWPSLAAPLFLLVAASVLGLRTLRAVPAPAPVHRT